MPSHLTRVVFRTILANKPLLYRGCLQRATRPRIALHYGAAHFGRPQQRSFLNLLKAQRVVKKAALPPGIRLMVEYEQRMLTKTRPPPPADVAHAFHEFIAAEPLIPIQDDHIKTALHSFRYLQEHPREDGPWFSDHRLRRIIDHLLQEPDVPGNAHLALARLVHDEIKKRYVFEGSDEKRQKTYEELDCPKFIKLLSLYGNALEGRDLLVELYPGSRALIQPVRDSWVHVLRGLARENKERELIMSVDMLRSQSVLFTIEMQTILVQFFVDKGDLKSAKQWYKEPAKVKREPKDTEPKVSPHASILTACARAGDLAFGQQVITSLLKDVPTKLEWDAVFLWSSVTGKGVDEVERMMKVMVRRSENKLHPDIDTINTLVEAAIARDDPYTAERYIALGERWNIPPNYKTFAMQIKYRLVVKDIDGARTAYYGLQGENMKTEESAKAINQLVQAMCETSRYSFDDVMAIVDEMQENNVTFTWDTVARLAMQHLRRGEFFDAADLLQMHAHNFSSDHRDLIRKDLIEFCKDHQISTAEAWDTYSIIHNVFKKTPRDIREALMNEFFLRKRSDMACHVFFHMRNNDDPHIRATKSTYVHAFVGFAQCKDVESLELVHNQLKLDMEMELDTELNNALMLAYAATGQNQRAVEFWSEIVASKEGPTYQSIAIVFRACEELPFGDEFAKPIWQRLKELDIEISKEIFTAYLGAISHNGLHDEAMAMVETVEEEYGFQPDVAMLGTWFNTTVNAPRQELVESWVKEHHPQVWSELEDLGHVTTPYGKREFKINRALSPWTRDQRKEVNYTE